MCCLTNEEETYEVLNSQLPSVGDTVTTSDELTGVVQSLSVLRGLVKVVVNLENDEKEIREYKATDLKFRPRRKKKNPKKDGDSKKMESNLLKQGERLDDLQLGGLGLIQDPDKFCFGVDAVLLSDFAKVRQGETVLDMGTGNGIIPVFWLERRRESILPDWRFRQIRLRWHREVSVIITWRTEWRL